MSLCVTPLLELAFSCVVKLLAGAVETLVSFVVRLFCLVCERIGLRLWVDVKRLPCLSSGSRLAESMGSSCRVVRSYGSSHSMALSIGLARAWKPARSCPFVEALPALAHLQRRVGITSKGGSIGGGRGVLPAGVGWTAGGRRRLCRGDVGKEIVAAACA